MAAKKGFSERAWEQIINEDMSGAWIDGSIEVAQKRPDDPFADVGPILTDILKKGVTKEQLCRVMRAVKYETVFATVLLAAEEELDAELLEAVHEELLMADPSGMDGRPGSWPIKPTPAPKAAPSAKNAPEASKAEKPAGKTAGGAVSKSSGGDGKPLLKLPKADDYAFSRDGTRLWLAHTSSNSSTIRGVEIPSGKAFAEFNALPNLRGVSCSPDGKRIAVSNHYGIVATYDSTSGKEFWKTPKTDEESSVVAYSPDGEMVLIAGSESCVRRRDAKTGKELPPLDLGEGWLVQRFAFSPDGKTLAMAAVKIPGADHFSIWDWKKAKEIGRYPYRNSISNLSFLPSGREFLIGGYQEIVTWDLKAGKPGKKFPVPDKVRRANAHPSRPLVAIRTNEGSELRDLPAGKVLKKLDTKELYPDDWAFSPDGKYVLLVASPKSFLWEVDALLG